MINENRNSGWLASISQIIAWLVTSVGAIIDALAIREGILALLAVFSVYEAAAYHRRGGVGQDLVTQFGITAFDMSMLFILGVGAIGFVIWLEYYFRKGREVGLLYKRIGKVVAIEVGIVVAAILIRTLAAVVLQGTG